MTEKRMGLMRMMQTNFKTGLITACAQVRELDHRSQFQITFDFFSTAQARNHSIGHCKPCVGPHSLI